jgi:hypothetical protein
MPSYAKLLAKSVSNTDLVDCIRSGHLAAVHERLQPMNHIQVTGQRGRTLASSRRGGWYEYHLDV